MPVDSFERLEFRGLHHDLPVPHVENVKSVLVHDVLVTLQSVQVNIGPTQSLCVKIRALFLCSLVLVVGVLMGN